MLKRADHEEFWQSVTGSMEWDESDPAVTARRELKEELGITSTKKLRKLDVINEYKILPQWQYRYETGVTHNKEHAFSLEMSAESEVTLNPQEHEMAEWLDYQEAVQRVTSWSNRAVMESIVCELAI